MQSFLNSLLRTQPSAALGNSSTLDYAQRCTFSYCSANIKSTWTWWLTCGTLLEIQGSPVSKPVMNVRMRMNGKREIAPHWFADSDGIKMAI